MSFIDRKKVVLAGFVWGISLAVFIPVYIFVIQRQCDDLCNIKLQCDNLVEDVSEAKLISSEDAINKINGQIEEMKNLFNGFVIPSKDDIQTLASIEIDKISREIGLEAFHIDPWGSKEITAFSECKYLFGQPMEVTFNATFHEFAKFLNMLERYKSVIFIDDFSITRSIEENKKHQVRMSLGVLVRKDSPSLKG